LFLEKIFLKYLDLKRENTIIFKQMIYKPNILNKKLNHQYLNIDFNKIKLHLLMLVGWLCKAKYLKFVVKESTIIQQVKEMINNVHAVDLRLKDIGKIRQI